ncbi:unnamed protein product, partial [Brassica oleracea var. botrytis]
VSLSLSPSIHHGEQRSQGHGYIPEPNEILDGEVKKDESDSKSVGLMAAGDVSPVDDLQKKIRRAEGSGVSVKLTEEEKRNSRAERYD